MREICWVQGVGYTRCRLGFLSFLDWIPLQSCLPISRELSTERYTDSYMFRLSYSLGNQWVVTRAVKGDLQELGDLKLILLSLSSRMRLMKWARLFPGCCVWNMCMLITCLIIIIHWLLDYVAYFGVVTHRISRSNARFVGKKRIMFHHHKEKESNIIQGWISYKSSTWLIFLSHGIGQVRICMLQTNSRWPHRSMSCLK